MSFYHLKAVWEPEVIPNLSQDVVAHTCTEDIAVRADRPPRDEGHYLVEVPTVGIVEQRLT